MLVEIRNYHYSPEALDTYREWAREYAVPFLKEQLDLAGFWVDSGEPPEVLDQPHGPLGCANVTWIIHWQDMQQRNARMAEVFGSGQWQEIFAKLPGGFDNYLRREARFSESF